MANSYRQFSAQINNIPKEGIDWLNQVLHLDFYYEDDFDLLCTLLKIDGDSLDLTGWPDVSWHVEDSSLWLYSEGHGDIDHVAVLVQGLIRRFMPDYIFGMSYADTCTKPRLGEFGGGWIAISKGEIRSSHTDTELNEAVRKIKETRDGA